MPTLLTHEHFTSNKNGFIKDNKTYKITGKIRSGGFGDVYKGIRYSDNLPVAFKVIPKNKIKKWTIVSQSVERFCVSYCIFFLFIKAKWTSNST